MDETVKQLVALRHTLHQAAERSNQEHRTAQIIHSFLSENPPDETIADVGGCGILALYRGKSEGPRILLRCDMDALPIAETIPLPYTSETAGVSHKCGHDGHMAILCGVAARLAQQRPSSGTIILLFQSAEETGEGAARVLADPAFGKIKPDFVYALHNLPGYPVKHVILRSGPFAAASRGLTVKLTGATSHAAEPAGGNSPTVAFSHLIAAFSAVPQRFTAMHEGAKATVIHACLGEIAFGTSPGKAEIMVTLRAYTNEIMDRLTEHCQNITRGTAKTYELECETALSEEFPATVNDAFAVRQVREAAARAGLEITEPEHPFAWSEDFGHFTSAYRGALIGLGAGENHPVLHHPEYDFPDDIIESGMELLHRLVTIHTMNERA